MDNPLYLIFLGPPGSGKGTQADILKEKRGLVHLSSGDLFRENIARDTPLGRTVKEILASGSLVPDDLTVAMVIQRVAEPDTKNGVIFDGFPRTSPQAVALESELQKAGKQISRAIYFRVDDEDVINRLSARRVCPGDGMVYNLISNPPRRDNVCDIDGAELVQRDDDRPETVRRRLEVYKEQTSPVVEYYRNKEILTEFDATRSIDQVQGELEALIGELEHAH